MRRLRFVLVWLGTTLTASLASGRGEWFDHYVRGVELLERGAAQEAIAQFEAALSSRAQSGHFRTYGNNYLRYVPQLQLALAYRGAGRCDDALRALGRAEAAGEARLAAGWVEKSRAVRESCRPPAAGAPEKSDPTPSPNLRKAGGPGPRLLRVWMSFAERGAKGSLAEVRVLSEQYPDDPRVHLLLALASFEAFSLNSEQDPRLRQEAIAALDRVRRLDPEFDFDSSWIAPKLLSAWSQR